MPVLILLIYYVHDLCLLNRYNYLTKFATYQAIQMIQSVTQNRTDKRLTKADFDRIGKAVMLCMPVCLPPGLKSVYNNIGFSYSLNCAYVQGVGNDRCKVLWTIYTDIHDYEDVHCFSEGTAGNRLTGAHAFTLQSRYDRPETIGQEISSTTLWSDLHIKNGEKKAIIEVTLYINAGKRKDAINCISELIGLFLLKVPGYKGHGQKDQSLFLPSHTIFYPNLGVFTDSPPQ